ncbi:TIGR00156 family protein [Halarcobacter mediterraneus]|uniref:TIGR00156 family protein n=1 Tax=Halarcobacter mediterraneus TaxID=2023153 RepID=A0A4Q1AWV7_9BACT|nr:NirD/YgiW/YdeI family stress tolerance protein [Halarcobacter mediterraneus]RXK13561.1 TIGR00156 family protein [Halarcobacter mediterraneus]
MKKSLILASLLFASTTVFADFTGNTSESKSQGGFSGPSISKTTIEQAKTLKDDKPVVIKGKIIKHLGKDKYLFSDSSGEITIEIDHDDWRGVNVGPEDTITIYGEIDKDWNSIEIDVDSVKK